MPIRRSRFGLPTAFSEGGSLPQESNQLDSFLPVRGFHGGMQPERPLRGYAPDISNFFPDFHGLRPRSGTSVIFSDFSGILSTAQVFDAEANEVVVGASSVSISILTNYDDASGGFSELSYVRGSGLSSDNLPSGTSRNFWDIAAGDVITDPSAPATLISAVLVNNVDGDYAKFANIEGGTGTYSDFTWVDDLDSTINAATVAFIDQRLVFANTIDDSSNRYPSRVLWSARGDAADYRITAGAGFEDILEIQGEINKIHPDGSRLLIFSDEEIWVGQVTRDDYAFRFFRLATIGCPFPRTIVSTKDGVVFLGNDFDVYILQGSNLRSLGADERGVSRVQNRLLSGNERITDLELVWAQYNAFEKRYELYYRTTSVSIAGNYAPLFYFFEEDAWVPQYGTAASFGGPAGFTYKDGPVRRLSHFFEQPDTNNGRISQINPDYLGDQTGANAIDATFKSNALHARHPRGSRKMLKEVWLEYAVLGGGSFPSIGTLKLRDNPEAASSSHSFAWKGATDALTRVPVRISGYAPTIELEMNNASAIALLGASAVVSSSGRIPYVD